MAATNNLIYTTLYKTKAHVFQINLETKNSWLPIVETAIPVAFVASVPSHEGQVPIDGPTGKRDLRIIGHNQNGEKVLDAVILQKTTFTKRSQKFGQWTDHTGMVYGLGFESEMELTSFIDTFQQLQDEILVNGTTNNNNNNNNTISPNSAPQQQQHPDLTWARQQQQQLINQTSVHEANGRFSANGNGTLGSQPHLHQQPIQAGGYPPQKPPQGVARQHQQQPAQGSQSLNNSNNSNNLDTSLNNNNNNNSNVNNGNASETNNSYPRSQSMFGLQSKAGNLEADSMQEQLKYENERLKQALEESSKNASIWHNELQKLTTNNLKLTQALHESKAHVKDWERELLNLGDENKELRLRIKALESSNDPEKLDEYKESLQKLYTEEFEEEVRRKDDQIDQLERALQELELKAKNERLDESATVVENVISLHQKQKFDALNAKLEAKIREISGISKEYAQLVDKMYH